MSSHTAISSGERSTDVTKKKLEHLRLEFPTRDGGTQELSVHGGEVIFVVGANGSGKSSLLQKLYADMRWLGLSEQFPGH